jgi:hypothetical protein
LSFTFPPFSSPSQDLVRCGEQGMWSTVYIPSGAELAGKNLFLFIDQAGALSSNGKMLDLTDTNLKVASRIPGGMSATVTRVSFRIEVCEPWGDLDQIALALRDIEPFSPGQSEQIAASSVASWDFLQTRIEICPLWAGDFSYTQHPISIPKDTNFRIAITFSLDAPTLKEPHRIRCFLHGAYRNTIEIR